MNGNLQINTKVKRLINYIEDIDNGYIQIPSFQRDFIWDNKDKIELFESIKRGYPIGSLLLWKPKLEYGISKEIGPYPLPAPKPNEFYYILDGFQRLSTIYGCMKNPNKTLLAIDETLRKKKYSIYYNLITEEFFIPRSIPVDITQIPVYSLLDTFEFLSFSERLQQEYPNKQEAISYLERAKKLTTTFVDFTLPSIEIVGGKIEDAIEIFTRINSKGAIISQDWMLSALTSNETIGFNLGKLINDLLVDLEEYNFDEIKRDTVTQCIQNAFGKVYFDTTIEDLANRKNFIEITNKTLLSIRKAVKFLFEELLVLKSNLLPYNSQLIFITNFFNQVDDPTIDQLKKLKEWFWKTTYANYFTIYSLSNQREAFKQFEKYLKNETDEILYNDKPENAFTVLDFPSKVNFKSVRAKAFVLYILNKANNFEHVNSNDIDDLKLYYLFSEKMDDGNFPPEAIMPMIEFVETVNDFRVITKNNKPKDLSSFLTKENFKSEFKKYFLIEEMVKLFEIGDRDKILEIRKKLIINSEKVFVEELGLKYEI
jgi:hypothetical protein